MEESWKWDEAVARMAYSEQRCKGEVRIEAQRNRRGQSGLLHAACKITLEHIEAALELIDTAVRMGVRQGVE